METILSEATRLDDKFYAPLQSAILASNFWQEENGVFESDYNRINGQDVDQTPAAEVLGNALADFFKSIDYPVITLVRSPDVGIKENHRLLLTPKHEYYPTKATVGGQMGLSSSGRRLLYIDLMLFDDTLDISQLDHTSIASDIATIIRHELIHASQYDKRAKKEKVPRTTAKKGYEDSGWIVDDTKTKRKEYLSSPIEVDAYAHEFAETLLRSYGHDRSLDILRTSNTAEDLPIPEQMKEYLDGVSTPKAFKNLMSKVYSHIIDLSERDLVEAVLKRLLK